MRAADIDGSPRLGPQNARASAGGLRIGAAAAGFAPWAKLYGWAVIPKFAWNHIRPGPRPLRRAAVLVLLIFPAFTLAWLSWRISTAVSLLENLQHPTDVGFADVPWLKDAWTVLKTHIWISGMSNLVFPTAVDVGLSLAFAVLLVTGLRSIATSKDSTARALAPELVAPVVFFGIALAYFAYRNFALNRGAGGFGGWYVWSLALPESLLLLGSDPQPAGESSSEPDSREPSAAHRGGRHRAPGRAERTAGSSPFPTTIFAVSRPRRLPTS